MKTVSIDHIVLDDEGRARIAGSRSKVTQIVSDTRNGLTPEMIQEAYPHLTLAQIFAALAYYHDHKAALNAEMDAEVLEVEAMRAAAGPSPVAARLRAEGETEVSVAFYMDEHIDGAISRTLQAKGIDVLTVQDDGYGGEDDPIVLDRASSLSRLVFTMDKHFLAEATRRQRAGVPFVGIVAHAMSTTLRSCIADLVTIGIASDLAEYANRVEYLPL